MSYLHGSPSLHIRRSPFAGDASQDPIDVGELAASRAAWKRSGGKFIVVAGQLRHNPDGWPEPVRPGSHRHVVDSREKRNAATAAMLLRIEEATGHAYSRPPTTRGTQWFAVFIHDSKRVRYPLKAQDAARALDAGLVVALEMGRVSMDEAAK